MTPDQTSIRATSTEQTKTNRALTYSEMMNEGRQNMRAGSSQRNDDLQKRVEELERKVEHLQQVIQRQLRLGRMAE
jgi:phosphate uptake regulator